MAGGVMAMKMLMMIDITRAGVIIRPCDIITTDYDWGYSTSALLLWPVVF